MDPTEHRLRPESWRLRRLVESAARGRAARRHSVEAVSDRTGRAVVGVSAFLIALWPNRPVVFAVVVLQGLTGGLLGPAIAVVSLGLVGHSALAERLGRNQRFASAGALTTTAVMGAIGYFLSYQAIFLASTALALPLLVALSASVRLKSTSVALADNPITTHPRRRREHDA